MSNYNNNNNNQICTVPYLHNLWNVLTEYCSSQINECLVIYGPPCMASSQHIVAIISRATDVHMNALAPRHAKTAWQLCYCLYVNRSIELSNTFAFFFLIMQHSDTRKTPPYWQQCLLHDTVVAGSRSSCVHCLFIAHNQHVQLSKGDTLCAVRLTCSLQPNGHGRGPVVCIVNWCSSNYIQQTDRFTACKHKFSFIHSLLVCTNRSAQHQT